jgi:hypothetical protein
MTPTCVRAVTCWAIVVCTGVLTRADGVKGDLLTALRSSDTPWAQLSTMDSDAYASGEALFALGVSGLAATDAAYQRGLKYLLRTQLDDGRWFVRSRAFGFQPYFESGFPHGRDQFISASATAWAAMALAGAL